MQIVLREPFDPMVLRLECLDCTDNVTRASQHPNPRTIGTFVQPNGSDVFNAFYLHALTSISKPSNFLLYLNPFNLLKNIQKKLNEIIFPALATRCPLH
jgi:hypothetical protein